MGEPFEACRELCDGILRHQALDLPQRGKEAEVAEFFRSLPSLLLCPAAAKSNVQAFHSHRLPLCRVSREGFFSPLQCLVDVRLCMSEGDEPQTALDGADAFFEEAAAKVGPARGVMAADVVAVVEDGTFRNSRFEHGAVEDQTFSLRTDGNPVDDTYAGKTSHESDSKIDDA